MPRLASAPSSAYDAVTRACGLIDRSEMGKLALRGPESRQFLAGQVTNDIEALAPGSGCYALLLTNKGKITADLRVIDDGDVLLLICERAALQPLFDVLRRAIIGWDCELEKRTVQQALFSLAGPRARTVVNAGSLADTEHANQPGHVAGREVLLAATDLGVDVLCAAEDADTVHEGLREAGAVDVPEAAAELLRIRSGRPRHGIELDETVIPQEAGLNERAVSFTKGCYVGQETVARLHYKGKPNRALRGLRLSDAAEPGAPLTLAGRQIGRLGSVADDPEQGLIGLAVLRREAVAGDVVDVGDGGVTGIVAELPFT